MVNATAACASEHMQVSKRVDILLSPARSTAQFQILTSPFFAVCNLEYGPRERSCTALPRFL